MADPFPNPLGVLAHRPFAPEAWLRAAGDPAPVLWAWELAQIPAELEAPARRQLHLALSLLLTAEARGHARLPLSGPLYEGLCRDFGEAPPPVTELLGDPRCAALVGGPEDARPMILGDGWLASRRLWAAEASVSERVRALAQGVTTAEPVPEAVVATPLRLSPEQRAALVGAVQGRLTLITGGPGTGKTAILSALVRALVATGIEAEAIALASPTGKAAQRMRQALSNLPVPDLPDPSTLHRLLAWDPRARRFRFHAGRPLRVQALVVDEASMVGLELMDALLAALPPGAKLVLLGDAEQLPSVEAGAIFRDLVAGLPERAFRLTHSHRMDAADPAGRAILEAANALGRGEAPEWPLDFDLREVAPPGVHGAPLDEGALQAYFRRWLVAHATAPGGPLRLPEGQLEGAEARGLAEALARWEAGRLLCPLREGPGLRSTEGINAFLHGVAQKALHAAGAFVEGEPVLVRRNDASRGLFNGDQGLVVRTARRPDEPRLEVVFPRPEGAVFFTLEALAPVLDHAYALTVHQAQGSEFDHVALVLPAQDHPLLTREILYTALTRAKRSVVVLGDPALLALAAARTHQRVGGIRL